MKHLMAILLGLGILISIALFIALLIELFTFINVTNILFVFSLGGLILSFSWFIGYNIIND